MNWNSIINQMILFNQKKEKGFTLIELMITIFVIAIGLIGVMTLIQNTLRSASFVRLNLIASYLAQEGVELTRNIRDINWIDQKDWDEGLSSGSYIIDYNDNSLSSYNDIFLNIDNNGFYSYENGDESKFKRRIIINEMIDVDGNKYLEVESDVFWNYHDEEYSVKVVSHMYNWY